MADEVPPIALPSHPNPAGATGTTRHRPGERTALSAPLSRARRLVVIDGLNAVIGASAKYAIPPTGAAHRALKHLEPLIRWANPTHIAVALDHPAPTQRRMLFPEYKHSRPSGRTEPYAEAARRIFSSVRWPCFAVPGYEADDLLATFARHAEVDHVLLITSDSDLRALVTDGEPYGPAVARQPDGVARRALRRVDVVKVPTRDAPLALLDANAVCGLYQLTSPRQLTDLKALAGDSGDDVPGVPGITKARAAQLLRHYGSLEGVIAAGAQPGGDVHAERVAQCAAIARRAYALVSLDGDVPLPDAVRRATPVIEYNARAHQSGRQFARRVVAASVARGEKQTHAAYMASLPPKRVRGDISTTAPTPTPEGPLPAGASIPPALSA